MPGDQGKQREVRSDGGRQGTSKEGLAIDDVSRGLGNYVKANYGNDIRREHSSLYGALGFEREPVPPVNHEHGQKMPEGPVNPQDVARMTNQQEWFGRSLDSRPVELPAGTSAQAEASVRAHEQMIAAIRKKKDHPDHAMVVRDFRSEAIRKGNETRGPEGRSAAGKKANETKGAAGRSEAIRKGHETRRKRKDAESAGSGS